MKKLTLLLIAMVMAINIFAFEQYFDEDGTCIKCKGTGQIKNHDYSKKKMGSREYYKCKFCNGTGHKPRKIDGKLLITKNRRRYKDYTIKSVDEKGITIIYAYGLGTKETTIKPQYWPKHLQDDVAKNMYLDSEEKIYVVHKMPKNPKCKVGDAYIFIGTTQVYKEKSPKNGSKVYLRTEGNSKYINILNIDIKKIKAGYQQKFPLLIVGNDNSMNRTAEILSHPSGEQLAIYFSGKSIRKANNQMAQINTDIK